MKNNNELLEEFLEYLVFERLLSRNTIDSYRCDINKYIDFLKINNIKKIDSITEEQILTFLEFLNKNFSESTVSRILSSIRSFYRFLLVDGKVKKNPFKKISNPKMPGKEIDVLSVAEVNSFLSVIDTSKGMGERDKSMFEILYSGGLRASEIVGLKLENLDLDENIIRFIGKGNKERITLVGDEAVYCVNRYINGLRRVLKKSKITDYVFLNKNGDRLTRQGLWKTIKKYARISGIKKRFYPHIFRHSFATHMIESGADLRVVQELLGHSSITTTEIYTNLNKSHIKKTYFKHHPSEKE